MVGSCGFGYGLACLAFHLQYNLLGTVLHSGFLLLVGACYGLKGMDLVASMRHRTWIALLYPLWAVADMLKV